jgi:hypothetical protein
MYRGSIAAAFHFVVATQTPFQSAGGRSMGHRHFCE